MEWSILPYDNDLGVFSTGGDSESVIVDGCGRYGGLLTGSAGKTVSSDIIYTTPIWWLLMIIKANRFLDVRMGKHACHLSRTNVLCECTTKLWMLLHMTHAQPNAFHCLCASSHTVHSIFYSVVPTFLVYPVRKIVCAYKYLTALLIVATSVRLPCIQLR